MKKREGFAFPHKTNNLFDIAFSDQVFGNLNSI